jgi:hypothetical protein
MFKRIIAVLILAVVLTNELVSPVKAQTLDEPFYSGNDILFYDPRCDESSARGVALELNGKDNIEKVMKFLIAPEQGLTIAQAAGVVGNLMAESRLDPSIIQGGKKADPNYTPVNGVGFGIAQWTFTGRQKPLIEFMKPYGDITSLDGQVGFMWSELTGVYADALRDLKVQDDYLDATISFHKHYEKSADSAARVAETRGGFAKAIYEEYFDAEAIGGSEVTDSMRTGENRTSAIPRNEFAQTCLPTQGGEGLIGLVKQYAWEEYKGLDITPTDAYRDAVQAAIGQKRYVGGTQYPGIDCGGFVTTLIIDSGFDKGYNYESLLAKGAGNTLRQEAWLKDNWKRISDTDPTDRQPGDVAINDTHTYIFVGPEAFENKQPIASASWDERAPMQGSESVVNNGYSQFRWYRKPVSTPASSSSLTTTAGGNAEAGGNSGGESW